MNLIKPSQSRVKSRAAIAWFMGLVAGSACASFFGEGLGGLGLIFGITLFPIAIAYREALYPRRKMQAWARHLTGGRSATLDSAVQDIVVQRTENALELTWILPSAHKLGK